MRRDWAKKKMQNQFPFLFFVTARDFAVRVGVLFCWRVFGRDRQQNKQQQRKWMEQGEEEDYCKREGKIECIDQWRQPIAMH